MARRVIPEELRAKPPPAVNMTISLPFALREALVEMATRNRRSLSSQAAVLMEAGLQALDATYGNPPIRE